MALPSQALKISPVRNLISRVFDFSARVESWPNLYELNMTAVDKQTFNALLDVIEVREAIAV